MRPSQPVGTHVQQNPTEDGNGNNWDGPARIPQQPSRTDIAATGTDTSRGRRSSPDQLCSPAIGFVGGLLPGRAALGVVERHPLVPEWVMGGPAGLGVKFIEALAVSGPTVLVPPENQQVDTTIAWRRDENRALNVQLLGQLERRRLKLGKLDSSRSGSWRLRMVERRKPPLPAPR